jgi:hypothetical protein
LQIPLDSKISKLEDIPHSISYVIRKRQQIDSLSELPKDKRPPEKMIWDGSPEDMEDWIDNVVMGHSQGNIDIMIDEGDIEHG